jgi:hypothetical protein
MSTTWVGPSVNNNLRLDLEKAAPALAKAGHATTGAPVMLSLKLESWELFGTIRYSNVWPGTTTFSSMSPTRRVMRLWSTLAVRRAVCYVRQTISKVTIGLDILHPLNLDQMDKSGG